MDGQGNPKNLLRLFLRNDLRRVKITLENENNLKNSKLGVPPMEPYCETK